MLNFLTEKISPRKKELVKNMLRDLVYYLWKFFGPNKKIIDSRKIKKILVVNKGVIGDLIVSTPMIRALAAKYDKVDVLMRKDMKDILSGSPIIRKIYFYDDQRDIFKLLTENKYDLIIIFSARDKEIKILCMKAKIPFIIGNSFSYSLIDIFITARTKENPSQHFVQKALDQARLAHTDIKIPRTEFYLSKDDEKYVSYLLKKYQIKKFAAVHAGKRGNIKRFFWPAENWAEVIDYISEKHKIPVILTGSSMEKARNEEIMSLVKSKNVFNFCEKTSLKQWACLIKKAKLLVSLNTGATHIASCFNTKTIVINEEFPELWHPWMPNNLYKILPHPEVEDVKKAVDTLLKHT
jgi:heptosyltransferase-2